MKNVALHNLGCKVNSYEMDFVQQKLQEKGYKIVGFDTKADIYIVNTCSVTNIADRKSRQMLHRAKKLNPDAIVVAMGCYVQTGGEEALADECIDLAVGNNCKKDIVEILEDYMRQQKADWETENGDESAPNPSDAPCAGERTDHRRAAAKKTLGERTIIDIGHTDEYEQMALTKTSDHTRAYIKIQDGCNQFCSYCIIPFARGRVRSRQVGEILAEIQGLTREGCREVVLTGIHISSYGLDWDGQSHLQELILAIHGIAGVRRIRLGSLEPRIITEEFARELSKLPKLCPHFHLSLQSGCDRTLRAMNRQYDTAEFAGRAALLRRYFDNPAITTDVIVGFPGETEEDFETTRSFLECISFFEMHIFPYSRREGTRAASMPGQLTEAQKKERSRTLFALEREQSDMFRRGLLDRQVEVLFEEKKELDGQSFYVGYTREYVKAAILATEDFANTILVCTPYALRDDILLVHKSSEPSA